MMSGPACAVVSRHDAVCTWIKRFSGCCNDKIFDITKAEIKSLRAYGRKNVRRFTNQRNPGLGQSGADIGRERPDCVLGRPRLFRGKIGALFNSFGQFHVRQCFKFKASRGSTTQTRLNCYPAGTCVHGPFSV